MIFSQPHRRFNPLTNSWILVSPQRTQRPWLGQVETTPPETRPSYDPACYLCPGNARAGGNRNPVYEGTFAFENDFSALQPDTPPAEVNQGGLADAVTERGLCRVICFSPRHDWTLPDMPLPDIFRVVETWVEQIQELESFDWVQYVEVFENKGAMMGASNPHPHCQVWASEHIPHEPAQEIESCRAYLNREGRCLLCDYLALELDRGERIVVENEAFVALVPFWAIWPFETMVLARRHVGDLLDASTKERLALADMIKQLTTRYDNLFRVSFPYSMGFHQTPSDRAPHPECHLHAHYYPPLLRSATVRKFMVGYEMLANPQRDLTAETAAERLRAVSADLYRGNLT